MRLINKINWLFTWIGASLLKKSLAGRLKGDGAAWLQQTGAANAIYNRIDFILDHCKDKNVLHIGFTDHPFTEEKIKNKTLLHQQVRTVAKALIGVDNEEIALKKYTAITGDTNVWYADVMEAYPREITTAKPELILFSEVIEHLRDPYKAVDVLYDQFDAGTKILVTVPNYTSLDSMAASLNKTESIHTDHHWYFSSYTLLKLFDAKRFEKDALCFGMYYLKDTNINSFLKRYPYNGDCIIAIFSIIKNQAHA